MQFHFIAEVVSFIASIVTIVTAIISCTKFIVHKKKSRSVCQQSGNVSRNGK